MGQDSIHSVGGVAPLGGCRVALVDGSRRWLKLPSPFFVHHASAKCPMGAGFERVSPPTPTDAHIFYWSK